MRLSSGGGTRRKRGKAARLQPVGEDASSTSRLFDATRPVPTLGPASDDPVPLEPEIPSPEAPLVRYEWRNAAGETLVVEAAWPSPPTGNGADLEAGNGHGAPHVDLRKVTELR